MTLPAVLITGGATRIGAELARGFAAAGWHVVIHYKSSTDPADALALELGTAETVQCDLTDDDAALAMVAKLAQRLPNWRCLINSASVFHYDGATNLDPATNREAMQVNSLSPARMSQAYLAHARSSAQRCVIQITDMKIANPNPDFFSYTMSKHALSSTIKMLAKGTAREGGRIYGIAPGAILASHDQSEEETELSHRLNLLKRKTNAREIVDAALFLSSGQLRSGETLFIDSGQHLLDQDRDVIWLAREQATARGIQA
ncbi:SDR family oxidoreductase [Erythrobacter sp. F6033]|uniref:SDR family oxidoreductase n=1 Tax=Erythrobacter sp. F6033 TaxID=2926401 RepID=UPI001FF690DF|nr:SDR family oxidoreductase [Erythrobacter sp. F6033]MCK0128064.1 SDR family oxidoreductase [Erythrobacter sp. F6033]